MIEIYAFLKGKKLSEQKIAGILKDINQHGVALSPARRISARSRYVV